MRKKKKKKILLWSLFLSFIIAIIIFNYPSYKLTRTPALHSAALFGKTKVVEKLLSDGANVNHKDYNKKTPLHCASRKGHESTVKLLIEKGADLNAREIHGVTALHLAVLGGYSEIVGLLVSSGADTNIKNNRGQTPFYYANQLVKKPSKFRMFFSRSSREDFEKCAKILRENGAE